MPQGSSGVLQANEESNPAKCARPASLAQILLATSVMPMFRNCRPKMPTTPDVRKPANFTASPNFPELWLCVLFVQRASLPFTSHMSRVPVLLAHGQSVRESQF